MAQALRVTLQTLQDSFEEAHDASVDITVTARCFWELRKRGEI
jgi:hypothetical protein